MNKFYSSLFLLFTIIASAQAPFITTWEIYEDDLTLTVPVVFETDNNYTVNFGDGTTLTNQVGPVTHTYAIPGNYTLTLSDNFHQIAITAPDSSESRLQSIEQWGDVQWTSMESAFARCTNLVVNATDSPNLSQVTNMSYMFRGSSVQNLAVNNWDVSNVTNMEGLFQETTFNQPLNNWNVTNVINMKDLFNGSTQFNQPLNSWNVSNVTNMEAMFLYATMFDQSLSNWNVANVTNMKQMFMETPFNQPINTWNVGNVTNMQQMFYNAWAYNQPLNSWNVSNVTTMQQMFETANVFNQPIDDWNVSNVTNMREMFKFVYPFNQPLNNWDVSNVTNMKGMFYWALNFDQPLDAWDVSSVTNMDQMFTNTAFDQPINNWNVSNVTSMMEMFNMNDSFDQLLDSWDVSSVTNMEGMFAGCHYNQPLASWDVSSATNLSRMFAGAHFNQSIDNWDVSSVTTMLGMFAAESIYNQPLNSWDVSSVTNMSSMFSDNAYFNQPLDQWDVSNVTTMQSMFRDTGAFNQPIQNWDITALTNMWSMFNNAAVFNQPLGNWDVSNVINMRSSFQNATAFNQDLSDWNFNPNVVLGVASSFGIDVGYFLSYSGMNSDNYDALLLRFAQLELPNKYMRAHQMEYCNSGVRGFLINNLGWTIIGDAQGGECSTNSIIGDVLYDEDANGCTIADVKGVNVMMAANTSEFNYVTFSTAEGTYLVNAMEDTYIVEPINLPSYFTSSPASSTVTIVGSGISEELNFCLTANQAIADLNVSILPLTEARPGFDAEYQLVVENIGTQSILNASVVLVFDSDQQTFIQSQPAPNTNTSGELTYNLGNVAPFTVSTIHITMNTMAPPTVNGGDILHLSAAVSPSTNDFTMGDNLFELAQPVVNAYDPNDKTVLQGDQILIEDVDEYLHYIIRFQNTGSASAINVRIEDLLHSDLDWQTLRPINASHQYRVEITDENHLAFLFDNINLPSETEDAAGSSGFIAYKIKPVQTIEVGDIISGNASIFFDYNLPIVTNTVSTEVVETLAVETFDHDSAFSVYPNPTDGVLNVKIADGITVRKMTLTNLQGQELQSFNSTQTISIDTMRAGMYFISVITDVGTFTKKIIKY